MRKKQKYGHTRPNYLANKKNIYAKRNLNKKQKMSVEENFLARNPKRKSKARTRDTEEYVKEHQNITIQLSHTIMIRPLCVEAERPYHSCAFFPPPKPIITDEYEGSKQNRGKTKKSKIINSKSCNSQNVITHFNKKK